jgi:hypothetical protein
MSTVRGAFDPETLAMLKGVFNEACSSTHRTDLSRFRSFAAARTHRNSAKGTCAGIQNRPAKEQNTNALKGRTLALNFET